MKKIIDSSPFPDDSSVPPWNRGQTPAWWITTKKRQTCPVAMLFELEFFSEQDRNITIHITADERYILHVNSEEVGRGSEAGSMRNWFYDSYEIYVRKGNNRISALVWAVGKYRAFARTSAGPAFWLAGCEEGLELSTGYAKWRVKKLKSYQFKPSLICWGKGNDCIIDAGMIAEDQKREWESPRKEIVGRESGKSIAWKDEERLLTPSTIPAMETRPYKNMVVRYAAGCGRLGEGNAVNRCNHDPALAETWTAMLQDKSVVRVRAGCVCEIIIDMQDYVCAYNGVSLSGGKGSIISLDWAESLYCNIDGDSAKGNRNEINGKFFIGEGDHFIAGENNDYLEGLWWHAGRYLRIRIETGDDDLIFRSLNLIHSCYPLDVKVEFSFSDHRLEEIAPLMIHTLRMCTHETYMDCPYYEQLMYVGDSRLESLITYVLCDDDAMPRKAIKMFNHSRECLGAMSSRYPCYSSQYIPGFDMIWIIMLHDFGLWRGDRFFVKEMMRGVRGIIALFQDYINDVGLLASPPGWQFMDWVSDWDYGVPPLCNDGVSPVLNLLFVYSLNLAAELEDWVGDRMLAQFDRTLAEKIFQNVSERFWSESQGMFAEDMEHNIFCEHSQCLAVLSGMLPEKEAGKIMDNAANYSSIKKTTVYFSHYWFEAAYNTKKADLIFSRLQNDWFYLPKLGFKTVCERPLPSRSDCHAWSSHPLFHYFASIMGIRPKSLGASECSINPLMGDMEYCNCTMFFRGTPVSMSKDTRREK
jgi:hypothetical protein